MELSAKTILVTGAGGFIGRHIVNIFAEHGWTIYAFVHRNLPKEFENFENIKIIKGDISDPNILDKITIRPEVIVHAAGLASDVGADEIYRKLNFESTKTFAKIPHKKFIFISSTDVYGIKDFNGENEDELPYETKPLSPYPKYKIESEKWVKANLQNYVIIRPAAVWGEGDKTIGRRVVSFLRTSPVIINFGKWRGKNRWPLADVKNVAKVIYATSVLDDFNNEAINIIDEKRTTAEQYYRQVAAEYLPGKTFKTINLPIWLGKAIGLFSTILSNLLGRTTEIFDPTYYSVCHIASNLDFSCEKQNRVLEKYEELV